jgi:hypothetical protein
MTNLTVANTILQQLGGNHLIAMAGAKNFVGDKNSLIFSIGRNSSKANKVRVTLMPSDTYKVEFFQYRNLDLKVLQVYEDVYVDNLRSIFTSYTGLDISL